MNIVKLERSYELLETFQCGYYVPALREDSKIEDKKSSFLPSANKMFQYHHALVILCSVGEFHILQHGHYNSALEHVRVLILSD